MSSEPSAFSIHDFLTVSQAAALLGVSAATLRNWDKSGKLQPLRHPMNGYRLYARADLEALMRQFSHAGKEAS
ncbi:MerR family transcriptional regulator [Noviherbaspirillum malthae]|jgi:excisionase family DNA binding protein|uniref:MerR family transcriptional regulator n=1 Tax=Noviherbaspirillum malthae TaxID=1260987 RepID=UPI00188E37FC|nr:helix-turn-helix domain-containing protein [Noviherbaspirillum malthae]